MNSSWPVWNNWVTEIELKVPCNKVVEDESREVCPVIAIEPPPEKFHVVPLLLIPVKLPDMKFKLPGVMGKAPAGPEFCGVVIPVTVVTAMELPWR